jgi:beta-phosphoglucomutase-like phosphatase (HAD superfamily)
VALELSGIRAVLFDVDGTIAETEGEGHLPAFNQVFQEFGLSWHWTSDDYAALLKITGGAERMLAHARQINDVAMVSESGQATIAQMHRRKNEIYAERLQSGLLKPRPGFVDLVRRLADANIDWAVVTTTSRANWDALWTHAIGGADVLPAPRMAICGEDVGRKKPDPQAYILALSRLNIMATQAIAIEDSPNGLLAARGAGIDTVIVRSQFFMDADATGATCVVGQLTELL